MAVCHQEVLQGVEKKSKMAELKFHQLFVCTRYATDSCSLRAAILTFLTYSVITLVATVVALLPKWLPWIEWPENVH